MAYAPLGAKGLSKTEASDMAKLTAWWHFVRCLGSRVWDNFDLKLFQCVCALPQKVLSSTAFSANGQGVKGSPAQFLCEVLLTPSLLKECTKNENVVHAGTVRDQPPSGGTGILSKCVVELLDRNAQFIPGPEALWRLWSKVASTLQDHISQTNEVNQGDSLEYNFDCMYATLMLPVSHHLVMEGIVEGVNSEGEEPPVFAKKKPSESAAQLNVAAITSIDVVTVLVTHVTISSIIGHMLEKLAPPLAGLMTAATKKTSVKLHTPASLQKLDKLWLDVCTMIQSRYSGPYDSDLLAHLSPLLQATFLHPRRQIKNQAVLLWNATFSRSAPLTYPAELQPVLTKVKEKTQIMLPGWSNVDVAVIEETPFSQMSQPDSMAPEPVIPGMPSPTRIRGSFLRKDVSPSPKAAAVSPRRINPAEHRPFGGSARKKLSVDLMPEDDFVVITNTPKKRRVLTEHQKEVLKEKRVIPAMYNNLDARKTFH
nr:hypothetical protein BaRGS_029447 [Batillaria attramentaria]